MTYTTYIISNISTINRQEEEPKNLKHLHSTKWGRAFRSNFSTTRPRDVKVTMATENLKNALIKC